MTVWLFSQNACGRWSDRVRGEVCAAAPMDRMDHFAARCFGPIATHDPGMLQLVRAGPASAQQRDHSRAQRPVGCELQAFEKDTAELTNDRSKASAWPHDCVLSTHLRERVNEPGSHEQEIATR
jgi:hypothetical protein